MTSGGNMNQNPVIERAFSDLNAVQQLGQDVANVLSDLRPEELAKLATIANQESDIEALAAVHGIAKQQYDASVRGDPFRRRYRAVHFWTASVLSVHGREPGVAGAYLMADHAKIFSSLVSMASPVTENPSQGS